MNALAKSTPMFDGMLNAELWKNNAKSKHINEVIESEIDSSDFILSCIEYGMEIC